VEALDEVGLKRMVLALEKKINANQMARLKYAGDPRRFMDSEVELDEEINRLSQVAASPELYPKLVELGAVGSLVSLLGHENTDLVADVISVLRELTDPELTLDEAPEALRALVRELLAQQAPELLLQHLARLDEQQSPDDRQAVYEALQVFENLLEVLPEQADELVERVVAGEGTGAGAGTGTGSGKGGGGLLGWLLGRVGRAPLDENAVYAAELLAVLSSTSAAARRRLAEPACMEALLTCLARFKRREVRGDELEYLENLFDALCAALLHEPECRRSFQAAEGFELLLLMLKARGTARRPALRALDFALQDNPEGAQRFVEALGLKTIFKLLMRTGRSSSGAANAGRKRRKKERDGGQDAKEEEEEGAQEEEDSARAEAGRLADEEHLVSALRSLVAHCTGEPRLRCLYKFREADHEKLDRLLELRDKYEARLARLPPVPPRRDDEEEEDEEAAEARYLARLEAGLFTLQLIDLLLAELAVSEDAPDLRDRILYILHRKDIDPARIAASLREYARHLGDGPERPRILALVRDAAALFEDASASAAASASAPASTPAYESASAT
jgi:beta-catenin-like protein 1